MLGGGGGEANGRDEAGEDESEHEEFSGMLDCRHDKGTTGWRSTHGRGRRFGDPPSLPNRSNGRTYFPRTLLLRAQVVGIIPAVHFSPGWGRPTPRTGPGRPVRPTRVTPSLTFTGGRA